MSKRSIIAIIVIVILALAIPLTIRLVQQQQILKSRALTSGSGSFSEDFNGGMEGGNCEQRPSGWNVWNGDAGGNACLAGESGTKVTGNSQKILPAGEASLDQPKGGMWTGISVTPGATYRLTGWAKRPFDRSLDFVGFELCNQNRCLQKDWRKLFLKHGPGDFYNFTEDFTASGLPLEGFLDLHVFITAGLNPCCEGPGDVYFDDLSFGPTSVGPPVSPSPSPPPSTPPTGPISASPNPCTIPTGSSTCTTTITWNAGTDGNAQIWVKDTVDSTNLYTLFAQGATGSQTAPWIQASPHSYTFKLMGGTAGNPTAPPAATPPGTELDDVVVTGQTSAVSHCFIVTETPSQRDGLLSCSSSGARAYTQHPQTVSPFTLSSGNGAKNLFVRFLKTNQGETLANCSDANKCVDSQYAISLSIPVGSCSCLATNFCSAACSFANPPTGLPADITYASPMKCSLAAAMFLTGQQPTQADKDAWCNRATRTRGNANSDAEINEDDFGYVVGAANGGKIPKSVNPDFNGDGDVGSNDRCIYRVEKGLACN